MDLILYVYFSPLYSRSLSQIFLVVKLNIFSLLIRFLVPYISIWRSLFIILASYLSYFLVEIFLLGNNIQEKGDEKSQEITKDNRALIDNNKAQSLTGEDIDAMRRWEHHALVSWKFSANVNSCILHPGFPPKLIHVYHISLSKNYVINKLQRDLCAMYSYKRASVAVVMYLLVPNVAATIFIYLFIF